jgi:hypothetical protein
VPLTAIRLPAGTSGFLSGYFIDNRLDDPLPMAPSPRKTKTSSTAAVPTVVFAFIYNVTSFFRGDILVTHSLMGQISRARQGLKSEAYN